MREVVCLEAGDQTLVGTQHVCKGLEKEATSVDAGVVFFNAGHVARAAVGDLMAHAADAVCELGLPVFRFDFPGIGDSAGGLPETQNEYFRQIQEGRHRGLALALLEGLRQAFGLKGFVLGGLCGGAVTALYTAAKAPKATRGLMLLDPDFSLVSDMGRGFEGGQDQTAGKHRWLSALSSRYLAAPKWCRVLTGEACLPGRLARARSSVLSALRWFLNDRMAPGTNLSLVRCLRRVVKHRIPTLIIAASGKQRDVYLRQVEKALFRGDKCECIERPVFPQTNHVFLAGGGKARVTRAMVEWLASRSMW